MSKEDAKNFRKVNHCLSCDYSVVTGFDMGSKADWCDLHKFSFRDEIGLHTCDDHKPDIGTIRPHPMRAILKGEL